MAKDPRITAIEQEAHRRSLADDGKTSKGERFGIRQTLRAEAGLGREKKKRGGAAGVWDRNKNVIVPVAAGLAGLASGGLLAPIAVGAAARGLDRPGQGGIGFDVGDAARGGLEGAAYGGIGSAVGGMMQPSAAQFAASIPGGPALSGGAMPPVAVGGAGAIGATPPIAVAAGGNVLQRAGDWLTKDGGRNALGVAQGANAAYNIYRGNQIAGRAVRGREAEWKAGQPLRDAGRAGLLRGVPGNPFAPVGV